MTARAEGPATTVKVAQAKGRPMLSWVGKRPLRESRTYPAQFVEHFGMEGDASASVDWSDWPQEFGRGGLLFHGDNREVLAYHNDYERRADLVDGTYDFDLPADSTAVAVRITDMLGKEVLVVLPVAPDA